jgi:curved DNA-binding protein CbpA
MEGQLSKHPLAELVREIAAAGLSGALRLSHERAKAAIYFEDGGLVFAASNLRAHRLREVLKRGGFSDNGLPARASDDDLAEALIKSGRVTSETLLAIRSRQVSDVLRVVLLWTNGTWELDPRVRLADDLRVAVDVNRLLLECARHLPTDFLGTRFRETNGVSYQVVAGKDSANLTPAEASILALASAPIRLSDLSALQPANKEDNLRAVYALSLSGFLHRSEWPAVFDADTSKAPRPSPSKSRARVSAAEPTDESSDVQALFARLAGAKDHYEVLDTARLADAEEIKNAYHSLARRFHPDRFHKSDSVLRSQIDSAFARIAQAYETLGDSSLRAAYDAKLKTKGPAAAKTRNADQEKSAKAAAKSGKEIPNAEPAESSFQNGLAALRQNQRDRAIRLLAEAAMLAPREARYRAHYGHALIGDANARRVAESELQTAVSLEPNNASHRVMLAEFYKAIGLRRRAQGEIERALAADPKNEAARALLASLRSNG